LVRKKEEERNILKGKMTKEKREIYEDRIERGRKWQILKTKNNCILRIVIFTAVKYNHKELEQPFEHLKKQVDDQKYRIGEFTVFVHKLLR
jgi:hypothetical protein